MPVAVNCCLLPFATCGVAGETCSFVNVAAVTVIVVDALAP